MFENMCFNKKNLKLCKLQKSSNIVKKGLVKKFIKCNFLEEVVFFK